MSARLVLAALLGLMSVSTALAYRLDEYLQATTIDVRTDRIALQLRLAAGVETASRVLADMDTNGDGQLSEAEQRTYAQRVCQHLSLTADSRSVTLRLIEYSFPPAEAIKKGLANVLLNCQAAIKLGHSTHQLTFKNHYQQAISTYLVNCLLPSDPSIHILAQHRSYDQSTYQLDFNVGLVALASPDQQSDGRWSNRLSVVKTYVYYGIAHILGGYDHLLFIYALVLGAVRLWELVKIATAFTLAHSISLVLVVFHLLYLPGFLVELVISASIVFVAGQNIYWSQSAQGPNRLAVTFCFSLFHGLGFAGGLLALMQPLPTGTALEVV